MATESAARRNVGIDLVKSVAAICVVAVHFFLNSGFYEYPILTLPGVIGAFIRTALMSCVPLFLISTG